MVILPLILIVSVVIYGAVRVQSAVFGSSTGLDLYGVPFQRHLDGDGMRGSDQSRDSVINSGPGMGRLDSLRRFAETRMMKTGTTIAGAVFEVSLLYYDLISSMCATKQLYFSYIF